MYKNNADPCLGYQGESSRTGNRNPIGARGHDINPEPLSAAALALAIQNANIQSIQLVAYKSIIGIGKKAGDLSHDLARNIGREFEKRGIRIALLGSYFNLLEQHEEKLEENMNRFKEYLQYARDFSCSIVGTETGSYNADMSFNPGNHGDAALQRVIEILRELVRHAERYGVFVGVEGVYDFVISTPKRMKKLIESVDSSTLQVIFDPVNLLHPGNHSKAAAIIEESFELFGERIVVIHAKDFIVEGNRLCNVPLGRGLMDYEHLMRLVKQQKRRIDIIIEGLEGDELRESRIFLQRILDKL